MASFPTLSVTCSFPISEEREDATIRSGYEAGYEHTRPRFTRVRMKFGVKYEKMNIDDKEDLEDFIDTVREGADIFTWTHPQTSASFDVRFDPIPKFELVAHNIWKCEFGLKQV